MPTRPPVPPEPPIPVAVALQEAADADAPTVVATGRGSLAEQILAIAFANGVKVRQDADLVQILAAVDVDSPIPTEAYAAVAEVLSYVYRANGRVPAGFAAGAAATAPGAAP
jgi:flagellar biosynthesis protein